MLVTHVNMRCMQLCFYIKMLLPPWFSANVIKTFDRVSTVLSETFFIIRKPLVWVQSLAQSLVLIIFKNMTNYPRRAKERSDLYAPYRPFLTCFLTVFLLVFEQWFHVFVWDMNTLCQRTRRAHE